MSKYQFTGTAMKPQIFLNLIRTSTVIIKENLINEVKKNASEQIYSEFCPYTIYNRNKFFKFTELTKQLITYLRRWIA